MMKKLILVPILALALVFAGCSEDDDNNNIVNPTPSGTSFVRVVHLSPDAPAVDVWVDGNRVLQNVSFKGSSNYLTLTNGEHRIQLSPAGATEPIVLDETVNLEEDMSYTIAATGRLAELDALMVMDNRNPVNNQSRVRFIHTSPDAPAVDVAQSGGSVLFGNIAFRQTGDYTVVAPNQYVLDVRPAGTQSVALRVPSVQIGSNANYSIFAVGLIGNGTLETLALVDAGTPGTLPTAQLRVAHLAPDAPNVDVWVNRTRVLENVPYQVLSDYLTVTAGQQWIQVTPAGAAEPVVIDAVVALDANMPYTVAATGLLGSNDLQPILIMDDLTTSETQSKMRFVHTSPDAPAVDIAVANGPVLFNNIPFRSSGNYLNVDPGTYALQVRLAGTETVVLTVPGLELSPTVNYTIFAIGLAGDGTLSALATVDAGTPQAGATANLRAIHLSPDAPAVDVWVNGNRVLQNVTYEMISGYLTVPAGQVQVQITAAGMTEPIVLDTVATLTADMYYTAAASGLLNNGDIQAVLMADNMMTSGAEANVRFVHTSPDAPAVDIAVNGGPVLFSNVPFRAVGDYLSVAPGSYFLEVRLAGTETVVLNLPGTELSAGVNYTVFAKGLVTDGTLGALPVIDAGTPMALPMSYLRVAHLSPDAPSVDIWVNGARILENVPFQTVSNYLMVTSGQHWIQVTPAGTSEPVVIDAVVSLSQNMAYTVAATGLLGDGDLQPIVLMDDLTTDPTQSKIRFVHTSPDAPAVDVALANGGAVLFGNVSFRQAAEYLTVASQTYDLEVRLAGTNTVVLPLSGVPLGAGMNYTVFAIGLAGDGSLSALPVVDTSSAGPMVELRR